MTNKDLGLKCGIEIHQQLEGRKLFCNCPTFIRDDVAHFKVERKLRASAGESGEVDVAAKQEQLRDKTFIYEGYHDTTCLVELDEEPPHDVNVNALKTALQFCAMAQAQISPIIQVMRKTVVDGSNTSGFQRTALIARNGKMSTSAGDVSITNVSLEEDACKIVEEKGNVKVYRLDRLGIPLIEIGTGPDITSPEQCQETAKKIGMLLRSLPGVKRGLGTIRQDVNVSIKGGTRIEIKGAQDLRMLPTLVELEAKRQVEILKLGDFIREISREFRIKNKKSVEELGDKYLVHFFSNESFGRPLNHLFLSTKFKFKKLLENNLFLGLRVPKFKGKLGAEIQPGKRLGTELSDYAKVKCGVGGIIHSDEDLNKYEFSEQEIEQIKKELIVTEDDAFILVVCNGQVQPGYVENVISERLGMFGIGVPSEVRKANADGTTSFMRSMPGSSRMYPETDVALIQPDVTNIEIPETLEEKIERFQKKWGLSKDLAEFVAKSDRVLLFEELVGAHKDIKPAFIAETLTSTLVEIKRVYNVEADGLDDERFRELFGYLASGKIHKDIIIDVLIDLSKGTFNVTKYATLSTEELHRGILEVIATNKDAPFSALMGLCMKKFSGKASGQFISQELKKILENGH